MFASRWSGQFDMGATPFSARFSQPALWRQWTFGPPLSHPCNCKSFPLPFLKRLQQILEAWLNKLQDYKIRESSGSRLNQPLAKLQHRTKEQVKQSGHPQGSI
jgi:hypothetical protein